MKPCRAFARLAVVAGLFFALFSASQFGGAQATCAPTGSPYSCTETGSPALNLSGSVGASASSTITVSGASGNPVVSSLTVALTGMTSGSPESLQGTMIWLEAPNGAKYVLLGMTGSGEDNLNGLNITLSDGAGSFAPVGTDWSLTGSVTVKPSSYVNAIFESGTTSATAASESGLAAGTLFPSGESDVSPYFDGSATLLSALGSGAGAGAAPVNGIWTLHISNVSNIGVGSPATIAGWTLNLTYAAGTNDQTATTVSSSLNPATIGSGVTYTAHVTDTTDTGTTPAGMVTFTSSPAGGGAAVTLCSGVTLSGGAAQCTVSNASTLGEGLSTIEASYTTTSSFSPSSGSVSQLVERTSVNTSGNTWCNQGSVSIPNATSPQAYPSVIKVTGYAAGTTVSSATVLLKGLTGSDQPGAYLLVAPNGQNLDVMNDAFNAGSFSGVNLTIEDDAGQKPDTGTTISGSFEPYVYVPSGFSPAAFTSSSAPGIDSAIPQVPGSINYAAPYGSTLNTLEAKINGAPANGDWALYINGTGDSGVTLASGWCVDLTVNTGTGTATAVTSSQNPATPGQSVTLTAAVTSEGNPVSGGAVTFLDNALTPGGTVSGNNVVSVNGAGAAAFASSALVNQVLTDSGTVSIKEGDHLISADYGGTEDYNPSQGTLLERIDNAPVTPTWGGTGSPNNYAVCNSSDGTSGPIYSTQGLAGAFTPNPSNIFVRNLPGTINSVSLTLRNLSESHAGVMDQVESLIEGPTGAALDFFSGAGSSNNSGNTAASGNYTFTDSAASSVPSSGAMAPGSYKPTTYLAADAFLSSACTSSACLSSGIGYMAPTLTSANYSAPEGAATFGGAFGSTNPNGTWSLFFHVKEPVNAVNIPGGWCLNFTENPVAVAVQVGHSGAGTGNDFAEGQSNAHITVTIPNEGPGATGDPSGTNPLTVVDTLNSALTYTGFSGTGWSCSSAGQIITCTNDTPVAQEAEYPVLTLNVNVSTVASSTITNTANVSGAGATSNSGSDTITVDSAPVLSPVLSHSGTFTQGSTAQWNIVLSNIAANGSTSGVVTVLDTLPAGYTMNSYTSTSSLWTCSGGNAVVCTASPDISAGNSAYITLTVNIPAGSPTSVSDIAQAYGGGDLVHTAPASATTSNMDTATVQQVPYTAAVSSGNNQSADVGTNFASPLVVLVKDAAGVVIPSTPVTFTVVPGVNGQGATYNVSNIAVTDSNGLASNLLEANLKAGSYTVTAQAGASGPSTMFTLTNVATSPAHLEVTGGGNQSVYVGAPFTEPLAVQVTDTNLNPVSGIVVSFSAPTAGSTAALSAPTCTTDITGSCSVTATANATAGSYAVGVTAAGFSNSFQLTNNPISNFVVNTAGDDGGSPSNCTAQAAPGVNLTDPVSPGCSLRDALLAAAAAGAGNISFDSTVFAAPQTITLSAGTLTLPINTSITGPVSGSGYTRRNLVTIDGNHASGIFLVTDAGSSIANMILVNGQAADSYQGGAITNNGGLTVANTIFSGNSAPTGYSGGAIENDVGPLTIIGSVFVGNSSANSGGAINSSEELHVIDSTFTQNSTSGDQAAGAIQVNDGSIYVTNSTISGNSVTAAGSGAGGIENEGGTVDLSNTIISGNTANSAADDYEDYYGQGYNDHGGNLVNVCGELNGCNNTGAAVVNSAAGNVNLAPFGSYGGPTQTMIPLPGSPAICAGVLGGIASGVTLDQRGLPDTNTSYPGYSSGTACVDAGAAQSNYQLVFTQQPSQKVEAASGFSVSIAPEESGALVPVAGVSIPIIFNGTGGFNPAITTVNTDGSGAATYTLTPTDPTSGTLMATVVLNPNLSPAPTLTATSKSFSSTTANPYGNLDAAKDATTKSLTITAGDDLVANGWAVDLVSHGPAASITINIDGHAVTGTVQSQQRPDVAALMGAVYLRSGWIFTYPAASVQTLSTGPHQLTAFATDAQSHTQQLVGSVLFEVADSTTIEGNIDSVRSSTGSVTVAPGAGLVAKGWAADLANRTPAAAVTVYIDGVAVTGGTLSTGLSRPDIAAALGSSSFLDSGWSFTWPAASVNALSVGVHHVTATATDSHGNPHPITGTIPFEVVTATETILGNVDSAKDATSGSTTLAPDGTLAVKGWAADLLSLGPVAVITVSIDGNPIGDPVTMNLPRPDVAAMLGVSSYINTGWSVTHSVTGLAIGAHRVTVVAADATGPDARTRQLTGTLLFEIQDSNAPPKGNVDSARGSVSGSTDLTAADDLSVKGWAADLTTPGPVQSVTVSIDGVAAGTATLGQPRPDVAALMGAAYINTGWSFTLPAASVAVLSSGTHSVTAVAKDAKNNTQQLTSTLVFTAPPAPQSQALRPSVPKSKRHAPVQLP